MPTISNTDAIIDTSTQLVETLLSACANNKYKMSALHGKHSKHVQCLSLILSEIENKHKNNIGTQSLLIKPYSIDDNPSCTKSNTKSTTNNVSALLRVKKYACT